MSKIIKPTDFGKVLEDELTLYHKDVVDRVNRAGEQAVKTLVKRTKERAPEKTGKFKDHIASKAIDPGYGDGSKQFVWYVKAPFYRLTHLLVHGHAKRNGGRVSGDPFLQDSLDEVLPEYEKNVEDALKHD